MQFALFTCSTVQWTVEYASPVHWTVDTCLHCSVNSGGMIHCSVNSVSCYTVHWTVYHGWIKSRARKQHFSAFHLPAFRTQFIVGPMQSKQLFFLNQTFAQCVFKETQPLPRSQTGSALPRAPNIETQSSSIYFIFLQILSLVKKKHSIGIQWQKYSQLSTNNGRTGIHYRL